MIVKSYTAPTVSEALKQIKEDLGGDAIVLKTRVCPEGEIALTGHRIEVTACIDESKARTRKINKPAQKLEKVTNSTNNNFQEAEILTQSAEKIDETNRDNDIVELPNIDPELESLFLDLIDSDLAEDIADRILDDIMSQDHANNFELAAFEILKSELTVLTTANIRIEKGTTVAFIGASGSGKTSVMAGIAAQLCSRFKQKIKLVSLDQMKLSAKTEIDSYGEMLDIPVELINDMQQDKHDDAIMLIDTPAIGNRQFEPGEMAEKINRINPDIVFFVHSACTRSKDFVDMQKLIEAYNPNYMVATHLDETSRWGGIVTAAEYLDIPIAFVTDTPGGKSEIMSPDPSIIAQRLIGMESE